MGFKFLAFEAATTLTLTTRGSGSGRFVVRTDVAEVGRVPVEPSETWGVASSTLGTPTGDSALYLEFAGEGTVARLTVGLRPKR